MPPSPTPTAGFPFVRAPAARLFACASVLALMSACASQPGPQVSAPQAAARYQALAKRSYAPPGPPGDPWRPYITEAAQRFDMPERWIREVMRVESSGKVMDTSPVGAMGLMQVMPVTYGELRARYDLGDDPYDPHDNVLAGTAYLREMYDIYGFPGFLAAYNAGPGRLDDYLTRNRPLPDETRNYVRKIGPYITGVAPNRLSAANDSPVNRLPLEIPPGPRFPRHPAPPVALAENRVSRPAPAHSVQTTPLPEPPRPAPHPVQVAASPPPPPARPVQVAAAPPPPPRPVQVAAAPPPPPPVPPAHPVQVAAAAPAPRPGLRLIAPAMADTLPVQHVSTGATIGKWAIQVGAYGNEGQARAATDAARTQAHDLLTTAHPAVGPVKSAGTTLYRARIIGLSRDAAVQACEKLGRHGACIVLSPEAQG